MAAGTPTSRRALLKVSGLASIAYTFHLPMWRTQVKPSPLAAARGGGVSTPRSRMLNPEVLR
jgi:hypothetical protein